MLNGFKTITIKWRFRVTYPTLSAWPVKDRNVKVETPIHDSIRELITWECKEHGLKS
jgi:hypothetical protein